MFFLKNIGAERTAGGRKAAVSVAAGVVVFAALFLVVLAPARNDLAARKNQWRNVEKQLSEARRKVSGSRIDKAGIESRLNELTRRLPAKSPTSAILEEMTKKGRDLGIEFVSITPQPEEDAPSLQAAAPGFKCLILPITVNMRATYKSLGEYLGKIENLESSFATVEEFQAVKDDRLFPKLPVTMKVYTYILKEAKSGKE